MKTLNTLFAIIPGLLTVLFLASPAFAAAPDGLGPWADRVVSFHQGLENDGAHVPAIRSNPTAALGVAEGTNVDGTFVSLGFGGKLTLYFDNGISGGVFVVESTILPYPPETAKIEISNDGINWKSGGNLIRSGMIYQPKDLKCAHYVRITDTSNRALFEPTADGYDVDGVEAQGSICNSDKNNGNDYYSNYN